MSTNTNILVLQSDTAEKKEVNEIKKVAETAKTLGNKAAFAEKYSSLIYAMPIYDGFDEILLTIPQDLRSTADYWTHTTKPKMMASVASLAAFCRTYTSYFPDLVRELEGATTVQAQKENMIEFLGDILPKAKTSLKNLNESNRTSQLFLRQVEENKYKLNSKIIPNIQNRIQREDANLVANVKAIEAVEQDMAFAEQQLVKAMGGTIASAVGLGLSATLHVFRKQIGSLVTKVTPKFITNLGSKISAKIGGTALGKVAGKAMPVISGIFVIVEIGGLIAGAVFWDKYKKERDRLQQRRNTLIQEGLAISTDLTYLDGMSNNFSKLLTQANEVADAFNQLNTAWHSVYLSMDEVNSKLKDLDSSMTRPSFLLRGKIRDVNSEFEVLKDKLKQYEFNFVLKIDVVPEVSIVDSSTTLFSLPGTSLMPNRLFSAYARTY